MKKYLLCLLVGLLVFSSAESEEKVIEEVVLSHVYASFNPINIEFQVSDSYEVTNEVIYAAVGNPYYYFISAVEDWSLNKKDGRGDEYHFLSVSLDAGNTSFQFPTTSGIIPGNYDGTEYVVFKLDESIYLLSFKEAEYKMEAIEFAPKKVEQYQVKKMDSKLKVISMLNKAPITRFVIRVGK